MREHVGIGHGVKNTAASTRPGRSSAVVDNKSRAALEPSIDARGARGMPRRRVNHDEGIFVLNSLFQDHHEGRESI